MSWFYEPFIPYRISQTPNGPVMHVGSVQQQNYFMPNAVQMPQVMLPYQPFSSPSVGPSPPMLSQTPTPVMQPVLDAEGMLWRQQTVAAENTNNNLTASNSYYDHHRLNEQYMSNSSLGGVPSENGSNNDYGQMEIEQMVNRHQRGNREHTEKQQAEAAVHQHFEESLKIAQQQRLQAHHRNGAVPTSNSDPSQSKGYNSSPEPHHPVLLLNTHSTFKLKNAWLQRYALANDLKKSGVNIDQNSPHSLSQTNDSPPVLQREVIKKRKKF